MKPGFANVWLLAFTSALCFCALPLMSLLGSLVGAELAPAPGWATLPIALMIVGTAITVVPASRAMEHLGRKPTFYLFALLAVGNCWLMGYALQLASFKLLCLCGLIFGAANAAFQQMRFAAMESVAIEQAPTAASIIMCGGILAAVVGPELATLGRHISATEYQGSFWLAGGLLLIAMLLLVGYSPAQPPHAAQLKAARPIREMLRNQDLVLALGSATIGYVVMSFVMTGTPISMHLHQGHSLEDTKWVIQSHIAAMFIPSLFTVWLFRWFSIRGLMLAGLGCYLLTIVIGLIDASVMGYWGQLVLLGIGWNFLFVSGTALLPSTYHSGEQFRAQSLNDGVMFSTQALAALTAGWAVTTFSWQAVLLTCLLPVLAMLALLLWNRAREIAVTPPRDVEVE